MRTIVAYALALLLLAASLLKAYGVTRVPPRPGAGWGESGFVSAAAAVCEAGVGVLLLARVWPQVMWRVATMLFGLFAIVTAVESIQGKESCGCFGAVRVKPVYTMCVDIAAVASLLMAGRPDRDVRESEEGGRGSGVGGGKGRVAIAAVIGAGWIAVACAMWVTRPVMAGATANAAGQEFGKAGELVVLEPGKWARQRFSPGKHIDVGLQLMTGRWVVLLVHHDCDRCAAAVPKYISAFATSAPPTPYPRPTTSDSPMARLAVIEMPPFGDAADPPAWQLPPTVVAGRLDQTRDWFASTPVAIDIRDGIVVAAREGDAAQAPFR